MVGRILFDVTRLAWRSLRQSPTGIDRVLLAYADHFVDRPERRVVPVTAVAGRLRHAPQVRLASWLARSRAAGAAGAASPAWRELRNALQTPGKAPVRRPIAASRRADWPALARERLHGLLGSGVSAGPGDCYVNVAHTGLHQTRLLRELNERGVRSVVMVHDLIPLTHPEFCAPGAAQRHRDRMVNVLAYSSLVLTNSAATADDLIRFARAEGLTSPPVCAAPLGVEATFESTGTATLKAPRPYFVCIGTLEARKNLAFLLTLWRRLHEGLGEAAPQLVLVGRRGWENEAVVDQLERAPAVRNLVHEVADLRDEELAQLLSGACALLAPSFTEGFDLPMAEAISLGTPTIASDIPAHRELAAGGPLIDPLDGPAWLAAIERAMAVPPRPAPRPFSWQTHFNLAEAALEELTRNG